MGTTTDNRSYRIPTSDDGAASLVAYWANLGIDIDADVAAILAGPALILGAMGIPAAPSTATSSGTPTSSTTEERDTAVTPYAFTAVAGVRYEARYTGVGLSCTVADDRMAIRLRYTTDGSTPTAASPLVGHDHTVVNHITTGNGIQTETVITDFVPGAGTVTIAPFTVRINGTGVATPQGSRSLYAVPIGIV